MHKSINNLTIIQEQIKSSFKKSSSSQIIAVSKTFSISEIEPLINYGHIHFGENKVQESVDKWTDIRNSTKNLKLHMIGKLQTNKVRDCLKHFDFIHSLDSKKLAKKIYDEQEKQKKKLAYLFKLILVKKIKNQESKFLN